MTESRAVYLVSEMRRALDEIKAKRGRGKRGRPTLALSAVNRYQDALVAEWTDWVENVAGRMVGSEPDDWPPIWDEELESLRQAMVALGRRELPNALALGWGKTPPNAVGIRDLADAMERNEGYLTDSLLPDVRAKLEGMRSNPDIAAARAAGDDELEDAIMALLFVMNARVGMYAGEWWNLYNVGVGRAAKGRIRWNLDPNVVQHCDTCLLYGDKEYESFADLLMRTGGVSIASGTLCGGNDRCHYSHVD